MRKWKPHTKKKYSKPSTSSKKRITYHDGQYHLKATIRSYGKCPACQAPYDPDSDECPACGLAFIAEPMTKERGREVDELFNGLFGRFLFEPDVRDLWNKKMKEWGLEEVFILVPP